MFRYLSRKWVYEACQLLNAGVLEYYCSGLFSFLSSQKKKKKGRGAREDRAYQIFLVLSTFYHASDVTSCSSGTSVSAQNCFKSGLELLCSTCVERLPWLLPKSWKWEVSEVFVRRGGACGSLLVQGALGAEQVFNWNSKLLGKH